MSTIVIDKEYNEDLLHLNEETMYYSSPFPMDDILTTTSNNDDSSSRISESKLIDKRPSMDSSEEEDEEIEDDEEKHTYYKDDSIIENFEREFRLTQPIHAPPPSPQAPSILDMFFAKKLNASLEYLDHQQHPSQQQQQQQSSNGLLQPMTAAAAAAARRSSLHAITTPTAAAAAIANPLAEHAKALDALLRKTLKQKSTDRHCIYKKCKKSASSSNILKALKNRHHSRHSLSEEDIVKELKDMGL